MRAERIETLFDEFVENYLGHKDPDVRAFLRRAGARADELGRLIDRFLELAPVEPTSDEEVVALNARIRHETPLTAARLYRRLKVDDVVERLRVALDLPDSSRSRLRNAYQELEAEQLNPSGIQKRVWDALQAILGLNIRQVAAGGPSTPRFAVNAYARRADYRAAPGDAESAPIEHLERDEVDELFRGDV